MAEERHLEVRRTARYWTIGSPGPEITDVWFVCHGYAQLAGKFVTEFDTIAASHRLIVAPEALSRFYLPGEPGFHDADAPIGATWMTREDRAHEIHDYVAYLDALYDSVFTGIDRKKASVTVLGFSQGGATANRWVTRGSARANRLIMWGCLLAADSDLNHAASFFRKVDLEIVYGTRDKFADTGMMEEYEKLLRSNDIPFRLSTFNGGHRMDRETLRVIAGAQGKPTTGNP